jgi:pilus assembly protein CpaC
MLRFTMERKIRAFKIKIFGLTLGMLLGLSYEAFAQQAEKPKVTEDKTPHDTKKSITIEQDAAEIIRFDKGITEVLIANPDIADVSMSSPGVAYVYAKKPGNTSIIAYNKEGHSSVHIAVHVTFNLSPLNKVIRHAYPNEDINIVSTPSGLILEGEVTSPKVSKDIVNIAERYVRQGDKIINNLSISSPTQVYLQVRVAEVTRSVLHQLDVNLGIKANVGSFTFGVLTGRGPLLAAAAATQAPKLAGVADFVQNTGTPPLNSIGIRNQSTNLDAIALLDALSTEGLTTILAEPNLVCLSGETAKVLVGGEFPYPVPQQQAITIEFKEYGIVLDFTPTILSANLINLRVRPEVSQLDNTNALRVVVPAGAGAGAKSVLVPAIRTRRAETSVEMASGQSLAIAGLFSNSLSNVINETPGLADIPILGALFRSTQFKRDESELVIIVTPYMVRPVKNQSSFTLPYSNLKFATHLGMILGQRLNSVVASNQDGQMDPMPVAKTGEIKHRNPQLTFEKQLASEEPSIPTNDQASDDKFALNKPEDLNKSAEATLVGEAGFYIE